LPPCETGDPRQEEDFFVETSKRSDLGEGVRTPVVRAVGGRVQPLDRVIEAVGDEAVGQLTLAVPNGIYQDWLEEHYLPMIRKALGASGQENLPSRSRWTATAGAGGRARGGKRGPQKRRGPKTICNVGAR
jgi:hypothetical protein